MHTKIFCSLSLPPPASAMQVLHTFPLPFHQTLNIPTHKVSIAWNLFPSRLEWHHTPCLLPTLEFCPRFRFFLQVNWPHIKRECWNLMVDNGFPLGREAARSKAHLLLQGCILSVFSLLKLKLGLKIVRQYNFIDLDDFLTSVLIWVRLAFIAVYFLCWEESK